MLLVEKWKLQFHHVGLAVSSIEETKTSYAPIFGIHNFTPIYTIDSQNVNVCFLNVGSDVQFEFIEPTSEESGIHKFLKKGVSYYHSAFLCSDIEGTVNEMISTGFKSLYFFNSAAFGNKRCIFMISPEGHLIEIIEK